MGSAPGEQGHQERMRVCISKGLEKQTHDSAHHVMPCSIYYMVLHSSARKGKRLKASTYLSVVLAAVGDCASSARTWRVRACTGPRHLADKRALVRIGGSQRARRRGPNKPCCRQIWPQSSSIVSPASPAACTNQTQASNLA